QGVVNDNSNKDFPGMVQVIFTVWQDKKSICEWIPVLQSYAGDEYGCYLLPEVKDVVLVGFVGSGMTRPFVLGSLFRANGKIQKDSFIDKNTNKQLVTKGGIKLLLSDEKDKEAVTVKTPKELTFTLADEKELMTLTDKKGENLITIDSKKGTITMTAKQKIVLKAGKCEITMDGQSGAVNIKGDMIEIKATQSAAMKANQSVEINGSAQAVVKGGMVQIN
ncbi:MAG: phage baseplate assembly protein V, partial [Angelakisella sp.]